MRVRRVRVATAARRRYLPAHDEVGLSVRESWCPAAPGAAIFITAPVDDHHRNLFFRRVVSR